MYTDNLFDKPIKQPNQTKAPNDTEGTIGGLLLIFVGIAVIAVAIPLIIKLFS